MFLKILKLLEYIIKKSPFRLFAITLPLFLAGSLVFINKELESKIQNSKIALEFSLRSELALGDYSYIARSISDLYKLNFFECVEVKTALDEQTILNIKKNSKCGFSPLIFLGRHENLKLKTLANNDLNVDFTVYPEFSFIFILAILSLSLSSVLAFSFKAYLNKMLLYSQQAEMAKQVAHDIRSPLSALTMVLSSLKETPEDKRILIRNATQRINDIANDLLQKGENSNLKKNASEKTLDKSNLDNINNLKISTEFIPAIIDILISEKRMQYRKYSGLEIETDLQNGFGAFAEVNSSEIMRVISNLVNNAAESFKDFNGQILVGVRKITIQNKDKVEIFVKDNGKGIPKHILDKLGQFGVTFGKDGTSSGSGLGVYHAKKTTESFGGNLEIESTEGLGSNIKLIFPLADAPKWFANEIDLTNKKYLISLDDDISIHQIWSGRLSSLGFKNIEHIKFQSGETFEKYINSNRAILDECILLIDFELINQIKSGLDLIEELNIYRNSILVTSRYEEVNIQERALNLNLSILPKSLAGFVPIIVKPKLEYFDWVLIDDDDLIHMTWRMTAENMNKSFIGFKSKKEFYSYKSKLSKNVCIYIDSNLGDNEKGEVVAKEIFNDGFKNLYLATGYDSSSFPKMDFIIAIVGKEPPI
jgi:signal transduction histidine kinase